MLVLLVGPVARPAAADITTSPGAVTLAPGEESGPIQLRVSSAAPSIGPVSLGVSGLPPGATTQPFPVRVTLSRTGTGSGSFRILTGPTTPPGDYLVSLTGPPALRIGSTTLLVTVVSPSVVVDPPTLGLVAGATSPPLAIRVSNVGGGELAFAVSTSGPSSGQLLVDPSPVRVAVAAGSRTGSATFRIVALPAAAPGTYAVGLRDAAFGLAASLTVTVRPSVKIHSVAPSSLVPGALDVPLRLSGEGFAEGARLVAGEPILAFGPVRVLSSNLLETTASVRNDAPSGVLDLTLIIPDGGAASTHLTVLPADSLVAPLAVRTAAVVHPAPGTLLGMDEPLRPRGVLAVSGTGVIVGVWQLDGVPFERFSVPARGGQPVSVEAAMPIPRTSPGEHRLEIAIETPQRLVSSPVGLFLVTRRASQLRLLAPRDRAVLTGPPFVFRWSPVPGAEGYEVEFLDAGRAPLTLAAARPRLEPEEGLLAPGVHGWRVRPVFPGGARGGPTETRRIAVLPEAVELRLLPAAERSSSLRWDGGVPGVVYRVDVLPTEGERPILGALAVRPEYELPAPLVGAARSVRVRVSALAPGGRALGRTAAVAVSLPPVPLAIASGPVPHVLDRRPGPASTVSSLHPEIGAEWDASVAPGEALLVVDDVDVTAVARVGDRSVDYKSLLPLAPGEHSVSLVLGDQIVRWTFRVDAAAASEPQGEAAPAVAREAASPSTWGDWGIAADGTVTFTSGDLPEDEWNGRASLSVEADIEGESGFVRVAGDVSASTSDTPGGAAPTALENRSWTITGGPRQGRLREEVSLGYSPPAFLGGSELMSSGLARGGITGALAGPGVELAYYETFDSDYAGVVTGSFAPAQHLRAAGLTLGRPRGRFGLRLLGLQTEEEPGAFYGGGDGKVFGLLGTFRPGPAWTLLVEAAHGEFDPSPSSFAGPQDGYALRVGLRGAVGPWGVRLDVRDTDPGFVNPANSGLTPGSIADRTGGDVELTRAFGSSFLRLAYHHLEGGGGRGLAAAQGRQDGGDGQLALELGGPVSVQVGGGYTRTRGDGDPQAFLPATDQTDTTALVQVSERVGTFSIGQSVSYQSTKDALDPSRRSEVGSGGVTLAGPIGRGCSLFANATATRVEGDPAYGRSDSILIAVQPSFSLAGAGLTLLPYLSYSRTTNDLLAASSEVSSYQLTVVWNPRLWRSLFALQASVDFTRVDTGADPSPGFVARYTFGLTLRRASGSGALASPVPRPPRPGFPGPGGLPVPGRTIS